MRYFAAFARLPTGVARDVLFDIADGRFVSVTPQAAPGDAVRLPGVVLPGFANAHSHAFHRALRGRTHSGGGTFWTWRDAMYDVADRLDPDSYLALARATYAEMALAGITAVGEFHYIHHGARGVPYADPNAMAEALRVAAADAGVRLTLLDACYLAGGLQADGHVPLSEPQRRFGDADVDAWAARVVTLRPSRGMLVGAAIHSVRAVPRAALPGVVAAADGLPLHAHVSEQPAENEACQAFYGTSPTGLLEAAGALGPRTTAVHATHLDARDVTTLGRTATTACFCPTTERDLADGIGPARALRDAGSPLALGSDQHAVIDLLEEARALESHERLMSLQRGRFSPDELHLAMSAHGSLGWHDAGMLAPGYRADLVAVRTDSVRTAGMDPTQIVFAASAADVDTVVVDGAAIVENGRHHLGDVAALLAKAIDPLWSGS
ncbi:MAG: formimidoylglutamate deiminase [Jatrophihabitantaceae bacterium]